MRTIEVTLRFEVDDDEYDDIIINDDDELLVHKAYLPYSQYSDFVQAHSIMEVPQ